MHNNLEQILEDLYQTDPSLREHDQALRKLVVELMELKPNTQFDEHFKQELRRRLLMLANTSTNPQHEDETKPSLIHLFMKRFQLVGAGVALMALLFASAWYLNDTKNDTGNFTAMLTGPKIIKSGSNAFGSLANLQQAARGMGGGGGGGSEIAPVAATTQEVNDVPGRTGGYTDEEMAKMIAPEQPYNIKYVYKGEELTLVQDQVDVLKRQKNEQVGGVSSFLNRLTMGLINFNSFNNMQFQSFGFAEDKDKGYIVNVSLSEGSINIYENWAKWQPFITQPCAGGGFSEDTVCNPTRIDISQVPSDQVIIDTANKFLEDRGIPRSIYGDPVVNTDWRVQYERSTDKANYWVPEAMTVVYPLMLEGQPVYDESGNPNGLSVNVRITPEVVVSSIWELTTQNYQSSAYTAETDVNRIMKLVEKGGFRNYYYADASATRTAEIELGTPDMAYVKLWNYNNGNNEELLVPALIFPVTKEPTDVGPYYWSRKNVVIPLVKEILDNENGGDVRIMPATETSAPSSGAVQSAVVDEPVMNTKQQGE